MKAPIDCKERDEQSESKYSFKLYIPYPGDSHLRYKLGINDHLKSWFPDTQKPDPKREFFIYLASWGYCSFFQSSVFSASSKFIANSFTITSEENFNKYGLISGHPKNDYTQRLLFDWGQ